MQKGLARVIDVVKIDLGLSRRGYRRIEIADGARGGVARVFERLRRRFIVIFQNGKADDRLPFHFQRALIGYGERETFDGERLRGDVLSDAPVAARGRAHEFPLLVSEAHREPVEFVFHGIAHLAARLFDAREKGAHLVLGDGFIQAVQPFDMLVAGKRLDGLAPHPSRGRIEQHFAALLFQLLEFVVQPVVFAVGHGRIVEYVIFVRVAIEKFHEFAHSLHRVHLSR